MAITGFDAKAHGLEADFKLTDYSTLRGWGCKVPQKVLTELLSALDTTSQKSPDGTKEIGKFFT